MYFQVSPNRSVKSKSAKAVKSEEDEIAILTLAPFTPTPKLAFQDVPVNALQILKLVVINPKPVAVNVNALFDGPAELEVSLSWQDRIIKEASNDSLEISWFPSNEYCARHSLKIACQKQSWNIPVGFKSISPKNKKLKQKKKISTILVKKTSPIPKSSIAKKGNCKVSSKSLNSTTKHTTWKDLPLSSFYPRTLGKENIHENTETFTSPSNISFNLHPADNIRRYTYSVSQVPRPAREPISPKFDDSLEFNSPRNSVSPNKQRPILRQINSAHTPSLEDLLYNKSYSKPHNILTPNNLQQFRPKRVSTEKVIKIGQECFAENSNLIRNLSFEVTPHLTGLNISSETQIIGNLSLESLRMGLDNNTYTKHSVSSETYIKSESFEFISNDKILSTNNGLKALKLSPISPEKKSAIKANDSPRTSRRNFMDNSDIGFSLVHDESGNSFIERVDSSRNTKMKRKSESTFTYSPVKRQNITPESWSKIGGIYNAKMSVQRTAQLSASKSSRKTTINRKNKLKAVSYVETKTLAIQDPFILAATSSIDPFLTSTIYLDEEWIELQEQRFKRWFNVLLTPPSELSVTDDGQNIDPSKLWRECSQKDVALAPSKEEICNKYHTSTKLDALRKLALSTYYSDVIQCVLSKIFTAIDVGKIQIRQDRNVHLDLSLQSNVMSFILSYNPLWLRIGLETVYKEKLLLTSNSDILGLSKFLYDRFFKDPHLFRKYKTIHSPKYTEDIKKFILKRYLALVYFLDYAKMHTMIAHDPCLFRKNAPVKESRDMLIQFSRETVTAGVGDINKYLKYFGYVVHHKQLYIHEFDYAVNSLGGDLRDGVRLTRVMEIILLRNDLTQHLRVPAISKLQKIHNVKLVFKALEDAGFKIQHDIEPFHIVEGHREKTLSFLWQIVYKFEAPFVIKSVKLIQKWWRTLPVCLKRIELRKKFNEKTEAARRIQTWFRNKKLSEKLTKYALEVREQINQTKREKGAIKIQSYYRMYIAKKKYRVVISSIIKLQKQCRLWLENVCYRKKISAATVIQKNIRVYLAKSRYTKLKRAVLVIEEAYVARSLMLEQRQQYLTWKHAAIIIQKFYRTSVETRKIRTDYLKLKRAVILIEEKYRSRIMMRKAIQEYNEKKMSVKKIQTWFRSVTEMRKVRRNFIEMKKSVLILEERYIAQKAMKKAQTEYEILRKSAVIIQTYLRAHLKMKEARKYYISLKLSVDFVKAKYMAKKLMLVDKNNYQNLKKAAIFVQTRFRANKLMKIERTSYLQKRSSTVILQRHFRAYLLMKHERQTYLKLKSSTTLIQQRYRAYKAMLCEKQKYKTLKRVAIFIQTTFRSISMMKIQRQKFLQQKGACIKIQKYFRSYSQMKRERKNYLQLRKVVCVVQTKYRAKLCTRMYQENYLKLKQHSIFIQRKFRANKMMAVQRKMYLDLKNTVKFVEEKYKAKKLMLKARDHFRILKNAVILIQSKYRAQINMRIERKIYLEKRNASILIQRYFRGYLMMKQDRKRYLEIKRSVTVLQERFRAHRNMVQEKMYFEKLKKAVRFVQLKYKANKLMQQERRKYLQQQKAAIVIQNYFRGYVSMKKEKTAFLQMKKSARCIQQWYIAYKKMIILRDAYTSTKQAVILLQSKFRACKLMKQQRKLFVKQKNACIVIQKYFRSYLLMKAERNRYIELKLAVVNIQVKYKAKKLMISCRTRYEKLKYSTVLIQRKFRANKVMKIHRDNYSRQKIAAIKLQRYFRGYLCMKIERSNYLKMTSAIVSLQRFARGFLIRKRFGHLLTPAAREERRLKKIQETAATKIQARWRGYRQRIKDGRVLKEIRERVADAQNNAEPANTLACRSERALEMLESPAVTIPLIIATLQDFEYVTRRSQEICRNLGPILPDQLYLLIKSVARSLPEIQICVLAVHILINLYKYPPTSAMAWCPDHLDGVLTAMLHCCDKEEMAFPGLCTLLWLFAHNEEHKRAIQSIPMLQQKLEKIDGLVMRKQKMVLKLGKKAVTSQFYPRKGLALPGLKPDWGFDYPKRPKCFINSVHACECLIAILQ